MSREQSFMRLTVVVREAEGSSVVPAWGRFLLRLAAIGLPLLVYWLTATATPRHPVYAGEADVGKLVLIPVLGVLTVLSVAALVYGANLVGRRQRYALTIAAVLVVATIVATVSGLS